MEPFRISRIAIVGGTHGNELSGVALVNSWSRCPPFEAFPSLSVDAFIANPRAVEQRTRYVDRDLNRCFASERLRRFADGGAHAYEDQIAQEVNRRVGPRFDPCATDVCIDLHNTTSNFGDGIIIEDTCPENYHWKMQLAAFLQRSRPRARVLVDNGGDRAERSALPSAAKTDLPFEVGPQPHGTLRAEVLERQRSLVLDSLGFLERFNNGTLTDSERESKPLEVFMLDGPVHYPTDADGKPSAVIAASLQGRDFEPLRRGDPVFEDIDTGRTIAWEEGECFPCFVGEAAYLESGVAFCKARRFQVRIPPLLCDGSGCRIELPA